MTNQKIISPSVIKNGMDYAGYRELTDHLLSENKTTGTNHSPSLIDYTRLNVHRMNRLDKHTVILPEIMEKVKNLNKEQYWIVITEAWCGDASQIVPVLNHLATLNDKITLRFILRDEHPNIMDAYLTNGTRSIPKLIILDKTTLEEVSNWGPRPSVLKELILELKGQEGITSKKITEKVHLWYSKDRTVAIQKEIAHLIDPS